MRERSARTKKKITYSTSSDDDDFADDTPPPNKKNRKTKSVAQTVTKTEVKQKEETQKEPNTKRLSIDDKIFQRNLKTAIKTSQNQDTSEEAVIAPEENNKENDGDFVCEIVASSSEDTDFSDGSDFSPSPLLSKKSKKTPRNVIKITTKNKTLKNDTVKRDKTPEVKTLHKTNPAKTDTTEVKTNPAKTQVTEDPVSRAGEKTPDVKVLPLKKVASTIVRESKPVVTKPVVTPTVKGIKQISSPSLQGRPKWTPPGSSVGIGPLSAVSPNTGLRLGLSRHSKLKPLHSNVQIK